MSGWQVSMTKLEQLRELLRSFESCVVAYSGGVDSAFLARVARDVLGDRCLAVIADSPSLPRQELEEALQVAEAAGIPVRVVGTLEFENPEYLSNSIDRCYFCKHELFTRLTPIAHEGGYAVIAYGENASDVGDYRPGSRAAAEFQVRAPLKEVGMTKEEIRELSSSMGLPTADKPQLACLSSRVPHGEPVSPEKLRMIEQAEGVLRSMGFFDVRVRHHELRTGHLARIELGPPEMSRILLDGLGLKVHESLRSLGYSQVTLDLQGYRRGGGRGPFQPSGGVIPLKAAGPGT
jgi:pyridinium-3,5-biscarboxylic acid mononucleotide sulfurtransferase